MSDSFAYVCFARIPTGDHYFLWFNNSEEPDAVLQDQHQRIPTFPTEREARAYAAAQNIRVVQDSLTGYDLVRLTAWCADPSAETLDCLELLNAWNLFTDAKRREPGVVNLFAYHEARADQIYYKLFSGSNLPGITPPDSSYIPEWDPAELLVLSTIIRRGMADFVSRLELARM